MADSLTSFTGLSSGMDWRSLVDQMMQLERRPADKLEASIAANTKRKEALGGFQALMQTLKDSADRLAGTSSTGTSPFEAFTASSTAGTGTGGRNVLAAVVGAGAGTGSFAVKVTALAAAQKWTGAANVGATQVMPAGATLTIANAGDPTKSRTLTVPPSGTDWTLAQLRDEINKLNTGTPPTGVAASLLNVSATEQRLVLTSTAPGQANGFTLADGGSGLLATLGLDAAAQAANPTLKVDAVDAQFSVDGVAMRRPTNTVGDVLPGVTLTLAAAGDTTVTVERQGNAATDAVRGFVDAYNKVQAFLKSQLGTAGSPLANDSLLRTVRGSLSSAMVTPTKPASAGGAPGVADDLTTLAALGVSLQKDGTLSFDAGKFSGAAASRLADVQALLAERMGTLSTFTESLTQPLTGAIDQREANLDTQNARYTDRIADIEARLEKKRTALITQYARFEGALGALKALGDQMTAQFSGLNKSRDD
jgi:flagellar hook-associated protein 2